MIKIQNKSHLATLVSLLLLLSIGINGFGNSVSFADTSKSVNDMQSAKEKAKSMYEFQINIAKNVYNKTLIDAKQSLDK